MENMVEFISIGIGFAGVLYAILTNRQKAKMENMVRIHLSGIAGNIKAIRKSTGWSWTHFGKIQNIAVNLESSEVRETILKSAQLGTGDSAAADRMLENLLNNVTNIQEGMFGTTEVRYPEEETKR
jgi:hypothetical protein